jgi:hypothetical protein
MYNIAYFFKLFCVLAQRRRALESVVADLLELVPCCNKNKFECGNLRN